MLLQPQRLIRVFITEYVAVARNEFAYFARDCIVAVSFGCAYVAAVRMDTERWFVGDVIDSVYSRPAKHCYVTFVVILPNQLQC
jgi:hypothetical protein